jgi:hypothetical protein
MANAIIQGVANDRLTPLANALAFAAGFALPLEGAGVEAAELFGDGLEDVVNLFHQGDLSNGVSSTRALSTSTVSDLTQYNPGGQLYQFQVPRAVLNNWLEQGVARELNDMHYPSGIVTPEIRISPPASGLMNQYMIPPGG